LIGTHKSLIGTRKRLIGTRKRLIGTCKRLIGRKELNLLQLIVSKGRAAKF
jgi:hypothetical protein